MRPATALLLLVIGCTPASAPGAAADECRADTDCVLAHGGCCGGGCCTCPDAMSRAQLELQKRACASASCAAPPDCSIVDCDQGKCPTKAVCENRRCVGR